MRPFDFGMYSQFWLSLIGGREKRVDSLAGQNISQREIPKRLSMHNDIVHW